MLATMIDLGIPAPEARRALLAVGSTSAEVAMEALFEGRLSPPEANEGEGDGRGGGAVPPPSAEAAAAVARAVPSAPPADVYLDPPPPPFAAAAPVESGVLGEIETLGFLYADEAVGSRAAAAAPATAIEEGGGYRGATAATAPAPDESPGVVGGSGGAPGFLPVVSGDSSDPDSEELQLVCGMGFARDAAMAALGACSGDVDQAIEMLLGASG